MTKITIQDTGFLTSDREGEPKKGSDITQLGDYIVNSGKAITLECLSFHIESGTNLSAEPNPSSNDTARTAFNTFNNDVYTVQFRLSVRSASDRGLLKEINALRKTLGVKLLYSSDTATELKMTP